MDAPGSLPEQVRARLTTIAADALGRMAADQVPVPLRRLASFAPARRASLGGTRILELAATDDDLRGRLGIQARAALGGESAVHDDLDAAALAWLERDDGWRDVVRRAGAAGRARDEELALRVAGERLDALQRRLDETAESARTRRERHKAELDAARAENTELRRRLGEARAEVRRERAASEELRRTTGEAEAALRSARTSEDAEGRRLRARVAELEERLAAAQRDRRTDRDEQTVRSRLLLDTLADAAAGLKRELGLPPVERMPADLVPADPAEAGHRTSSGTGSMSVEDPELLAQLLALPRSHLLVDGYNVTKTGWPALPLDTQRERLLAGLAGLAARTGAELTVVFDAAQSTSRPLVHPPRGVRVVFTPVGVIADDLIRDYVAREPEGRPVVVATSDRAVVTDVTRKRGVRAVAATALVRLLGRS